ncbi:MAG: hypothetical protein K2O00_02530 [Muribaculaceae bacterium]|nr:hypothetical protein [Muribaculaceae bacterium]
MKEQDIKLSLHETEQLCRLYMDCRLSVLEETELRYFLTKVDYHSPLIDDVRQIMKIDVHAAETLNKVAPKRKPWFGRWTTYLSTAATVALLLSIGLFWWQSRDSDESQSYYIAYVDGERLNEDAAKKQIEAELQSVDEFIMEMSEMEAREQQLIDNFFNQ